MDAQDRNTKIGKVEFSFSEALHLSLEHIRKSPGRSLITLSSITLGIAFMVDLLFMDVLFRSSAVNATESHQYWLVISSLSVFIVSTINSVLIAVYERYKEIGTMKCIGALDKHILKLFLTESLILSFIGGVGGFIIGGVIALLSFRVQMGGHVAISVPPFNVLSLFLLSTTLSVLLSSIATLYPAYRAAKLNPVEALRYEI